MTYVETQHELQRVRDQGYRYVTVTPDTYDPDMDGVDYRSFQTAPGFRTWAFYFETDYTDFRKRYVRHA